MGLSSRASFGFDDVALDWPGANGPKLTNQTVGGIVTKDSYLGQFGLAPRASNFTSFSAPVPSYMENLKSQNMIPSKSWAYTAGNQYRKKIQDQQVRQLTPDRSKQSAWEPRSRRL